MPEAGDQGPADLAVGVQGRRRGAYARLYGGSETFRSFEGRGECMCVILAACSQESCSNSKAEEGWLLMEAIV